MLRFPLYRGARDQRNVPRFFELGTASFAARSAECGRHDNGNAVFFATRAVRVVHHLFDDCFYTTR
jgi:hypothetical protein